MTGASHSPRIHALMFCCMPIIFSLTMKAVKKVVCLRISYWKWKWIVTYDLRGLSLSETKNPSYREYKILRQNSLGRPITLSRRRSGKNRVSFILQEKVLGHCIMQFFHPS